MILIGLIVKLSGNEKREGWFNSLPFCYTASNSQTFFCCSL